MKRQSVNTKSVADLLGDPPWKVVIVTGDDGPCDECGTVGDEDSPANFAYTVGLHQSYGLPEVHCPGLSSGEDPVSLTLESLAEIVNSIAARTVTRDLRAGSIVDIRARDNGDHRTLLRFTLGHPGPAGAVSAFLADPGATVIPVTWGVAESDCPSRRRAS